MVEKSFAVDELERLIVIREHLNVLLIMFNSIENCQQSKDILGNKLIQVNKDIEYYKEELTGNVKIKKIMERNK